MRRGAAWILLALAVLGGLLLWWRSVRPVPGTTAAGQPLSPLLHPVRPATPPVEGRDVPQPAPEPKLPPDRAQIHSAAYAKAVAAGAERPGEAAFRATIDAFMRHNQAFADAQAAEEGISVAEVHELTYFGYLVLQTQQWPEIEALTGHPVGTEARERAEQLMHDVNAEFKAAMRKLVADKAPDEARWKLIRDVQERYKREYFALTGMNAELLDDLLAGDPSRPGAPSATPIPERLPPAPPPEPPHPVRPETPP
ncbi:MAG: hypothetical protein U1A78_20735 [Polyangia bacterium]